MRASISIILTAILLYGCSKKNYLPATFLVDTVVLSANKQKIKEGDGELQHILSQVVQFAEKVMDKGPYSVTYKEKIPPSGDKRDYMSVGPCGSNSSCG